MTSEKRCNAELVGKIDAINIAQSVIEFNLDGSNITANENYLNLFGYSMGELQGLHHRMLYDSNDTSTPEY